MESTVIYEIIGYAASILVAVSLMMSKIVTLRIINLIGAALFSLYGILIDSIPVAAMNGFIVLINVYYLFQMYRDREFFKLLRVSEHNVYLQEFIRFFQPEIKKFQPDFAYRNNSNDLSLFVLRNMIPAGVMIGTITGNVLSVKLDFVRPEYRDFKIGRFLFHDNQHFFAEQGIEIVESQAGNDEHAQYLEKMGFTPVARDKSLYKIEF
jgi:GNAT superfamily N-acetyltransferase